MSSPGARVENTFFRYKTIIGPGLRARHPRGTGTIAASKRSKPPRLTTRRGFEKLEHETRFELAFPSRSSTSHTRCSLIALSSPFRWHALKRKAPKQNQLKALSTKKAHHATRGGLLLCGARDQIRTGDPHVGKEMLALFSLRNFDGTGHIGSFRSIVGEV